jgi:hypothetical protein
MLTVYAVRIIKGEKHRHMIGICDNLESAKHLCNRATLGNAQYAYVKDFRQDVVFFLKESPNPYEPDAPIKRIRPSPIYPALE